MSTQDMERLSLKNGDEVTAYSSHGQLQNLLVQSYQLPAGNLLAYYPEANILTKRTLDPRSKTPNFKSVPVNIKKAETIDIKELN
ncbi:MAG: anaerobic selenocysteine-containing dehydrogenase [Cellvibrionaceae bacterium]|jgi:anaerobic selenocysteine-containing dehydrogenase